MLLHSYCVCQDLLFRGLKWSWSYSVKLSQKFYVSNCSWQMRFDFCHVHHRFHWTRAARVLVMFMFCLVALSVTFQVRSAVAFGCLSVSLDLFRQNSWMTSCSVVSLLSFRFSLIDTSPFLPHGNHYSLLQRSLFEKFLNFHRPMDHHLLFHFYWKSFWFCFIFYFNSHP